MQTWDKPSAPADPINLAWRLVFMKFTSRDRRNSHASLPKGASAGWGMMGGSLLNNGPNTSHNDLICVFPVPKQQSWDIQIIPDILFSIRASLPFIFLSFAPWHEKDSIVFSSFETLIQPAILLSFLEAKSLPCFVTFSARCRLLLLPENAWAVQSQMSRDLRLGGEFDCSYLSCN